MRWLFLSLSLLLTGCTSTPSVPQVVVRPLGAELKPFVINGRIGIKHDGEQSSANLRWVHSIKDDDILLLAPFGLTVARLHRNARQVVLDTSNDHYVAQDTEQLTQQVLGWHLPLAGLRYWVLALPSPTSEAKIEHNANGQVSIMLQDGWKISYTRYAANLPNSLPLRLSLQREGLELRLMIDEWVM